MTAERLNHNTYLAKIQEILKQQLWLEYKRNTSSKLKIGTVLYYIGTLSMTSLINLQYTHFSDHIIVQ